MYSFPSPPPEDPADPLALLLACHERIDRYLLGLEQLIGLEDPADPRVPVTAEAIARYLGEGLPLHGQDEDRSLAPRLRALGPDPALERALAQLEAEHVTLDEGVPDVIALLNAMAAGEPDVQDRLRAHHAWLDLLLRDHMAREEAVVFPRIAQLDEAARREIVLEIRARRG